MNSNVNYTKIQSEFDPLAIPYTHTIQNNMYKLNQLRVSPKMVLCSLHGFHGK